MSGSLYIWKCDYMFIFELTVLLFLHSTSLTQLPLRHPCDFTVFLMCCRVQMTLCRKQESLHMEEVGCIDGSHTGLSPRRLGFMPHVTQRFPSNDCRLLFWLLGIIGRCDMSSDEYLAFEEEENWQIFCFKISLSQNHCLLSEKWVFWCNQPTFKCI